MTDWFVVMDLIEPWIDEDWPDAFIEPFVSSDIMPSFVFPTMVFATLAIAFYVYSDGLVIPLTLTVIFGGWAMAFVAGAMLSVVVGVLIAVGALLFGAVFWLISRG